MDGAPKELALDVQTPRPSVPRAGGRGEGLQSTPVVLQPDLHLFCEEATLKVTPDHVGESEELYPAKKRHLQAPWCLRRHDDAHPKLGGIVDHLWDDQGAWLLVLWVLAEDIHEDQVHPDFIVEVLGDRQVSRGFRWNLLPVLR